MRRWIRMAALLGGCGTALAELNVQPGDISFGLNNGTATLTHEQVRGAAGAGALAGRWNDQPFVQSVEFDNAGGIAHNSAGNLLGLNFGTTLAGGDLYLFSTDGTDVGTKILDFDGAGGNPLSRMAGLSFSPDNTKLAVYGADTGRVHIFTYNAGVSVGSGMGATATFLKQSASLAPTTPTQTCGTAWLNNTTVLLHVVDANGTNSRLYSIDVTTMPDATATLRATLAAPGGGNMFCDVEYSNDIAPGLAFCSMGRNSGTTTNRLTVVETTGWTIVDSVDYSTSSDTFREIGFGPDKRLYVSTFGSDLNFLTIDADSSGTITAADIPLIPDNSSAPHYTSVTFASFNGMDVAFGVADPTGACCLSETNCVQVTAGDCNIQGGQYRGNGTSCSTPGICLPLTGACCISGQGCVDGLTGPACGTAGGSYMGDNVVCSPDTCVLPDLPVIEGDLALGLSNQNPFQTAWQIRNDNGTGIFVSRWLPFGFLQSMEFDNYNGVLHNADGNLLSLDFGSGGVTPGSAPSCTDPLRPNEGGGIVQLSTDGSNQGTSLYRFNSMLGGIDCTRVSGLGVSPDNAYVSMVGFDTGEMYVLEYNHGATVGTGLGASIGADFVTAGPSPATDAGVSQGTTWYDNDTVMLYRTDPFGDPFALDLRLYTFNGATFSAPIDIAVNLPTDLSGSRFTDVEYNPDVSPFIYCSGSGFAAVTTNLLAIIDPSNPTPALWSVVKIVDLSTSCNSMREIALGPDGRLYIGQFAQGGAPQLYVDTLDLDSNNDGTITLAETTGLMNNSSVDYFAINGGPGSSFNGLDVAFGRTCGPCGDANCDGGVTVSDIGFFVTAVASGETAWNNLFPGMQAPCDFICANDTNGDNAVTVGDIGLFVAVVTGAGACQ